MKKKQLGKSILARLSGVVCIARLKLTCEVSVSVLHLLLWLDLHLTLHYSNHLRDGH